ncbi:hypothetical protein BMS3Abin17_00503 [archaeon BMS3Abin17]|nr:hypothetical protein BMS3Abin17_00503 [archaeon BMS3Abin17]HDZ61060.1 hypothetical protein [Candidatus Pacearchaeota archaeon]
MSLRLRIHKYIEFFFLINQEGLSLKDIERGIETAEGKYFWRHEAQEGIVDCMMLLKKPVLERRNLTKGNKYSDSKFWKFKGGRYFLDSGKKPFSSGFENDERLLEDLNRNKELFREANLFDICEIKAIDILSKYKNGIPINNFFKEMSEFFPDYMQNKNSENSWEDLDRLLDSVMGFESKSPYEQIYLGRKAGEGADRSEFSHYAEQPFTDWEYGGELYYPTKEFLDRSKDKLRSIKKDTKKYFKINIENLTLLGQVSEHCRLNGKTNSEFLRMHIFMQANLEKSCQKEN